MLNKHKKLNLVHIYITSKQIKQDKKNIKIKLTNMLSNTTSHNLTTKQITQKSQKHNYSQWDQHNT